MGVCIFFRMMKRMEYNIEISDHTLPKLENFVQEQKSYLGPKKEK